MPVGRLSRSILILAAAAAGSTIALAGGSSGAVSGPVPAALTRLTAAGSLGAAAPPPSGAGDVIVTLPLRNRAQLDAVIALQRDPSSPQYRRFLTPTQFTARFGPEPSQVDGIANWARLAGLQPLDVSPDRTIVRIRGSTGALRAAFGAGGPLTKQLRAGLVSVLGLDAVSSLRVSLLAGGATTAAAHPPSGPLTPKDLASIYRASAIATGAGETIAVLAEGDLTPTRADLVAFEQRFGLPQVSWTTMPVGVPSADVSGRDEWNLDTQYSTAFAPAVSRLLVYDAGSLNESDVALEINRFVTDNLSRQASLSAGECESLAAASGFKASVDQSLAEAVAEGKTLFAASGDGGSACTRGGRAEVDYPAASPYAVGVGGTTIQATGGVTRESAWPGSGGGRSSIERMPPYQAGAGGSFAKPGRGVPDVSLDADPRTGYTVVVSGQPVAIGGTSAGAPSWLGIWADTQAAGGGNRGYAGHVIYREPASAFNDIRTGGNGAYRATAGWDYVTGRGTPDITAFIKAA